MNPEIKREWIEALRSGKYTQGKGRLKHTDGSMCCLGVLCDIAVKHGLGYWVRADADIVYSETPILRTTPWAIDNGNTFGVHSFPPANVVKFAGLKECDPLVSFSQGDMSDELVELVGLSELNDDYARTFSQIADAIEESL